MKVTIDRFEGDFAIVETENGTFSQVPRKILSGAKEGDIISIEVTSGEAAQAETDYWLNKLISRFSKKTEVFPPELLPDAKEGDIISFTIERAQTNEKLKENKERLHRLFNRNK